VEADGASLSEGDLPLMGICLFGNSKDYVVPKWYEMYRACCEGLVEPLLVGDRPTEVLPFIAAESPGPTSEDMLIVGREIVRQEAIKRNSPMFIWQGIDCFYRSREDFVRLLTAAEEWSAPIGALTASRTDSNYAVARRYTDTAGRQEDIPRDELLEAIEKDAIIPAGFPGADALVVPWSHYDFDFGDHLPWYTRLAQGTPNLCAEEFWCLKAIRAGMKVWLHCGIRTWHVHDEDLVARMWPGIEVPMSSLTW
jgi:hypothetical protein